MTARIYRPARNAMQSGQGKTARWLLEYEPEQDRSVEPLMGWTSSSDMKSQIKLWFDSREAAEDYARRNGIPFRSEEATDAERKTVSYSDNFKYTRQGQWTH
jgi:hypothetical protein